MATVTQTVCDGCGKAKGAVNHWWLLWAASNSNDCILSPFDVKAEQFDNAEHLCGAECVMKKISEWMQKGKG